MQVPRVPPESLEQKDRSVLKAFRVLPVWLVLLAQTVHRELKVPQAPLELLGLTVLRGRTEQTEQRVRKVRKASKVWLVRKAVLVRALSFKAK